MTTHKLLSKMSLHSITVKYDTNKKKKKMWAPNKNSQSIIYIKDVDILF